MKTKKKTETGLASVYIRHTLGFHGNLRPAYDSAADAQAELTDRQASQLRSLIAKFMQRCKVKNEDAAKSHVHIA